MDRKKLECEVLLSKKALHEDARRVMTKTVPASSQNL